MAEIPIDKYQFIINPLNNKVMKQSAKRQAILDIKEELSKNHKCFLAFKSTLNPIMDLLVESQIEEHMNLKRK